MGATNVTFNYVQCASATACMVVGSYQDSSGDIVPLAELWSGSNNWSTPTTPPLPTGGTDGALYGVSCPAANACVAVGEYRLTSTSPELPLAEAWNGSAWSATPNQPSDPTTKNAFLHAVWCWSGSSCTAVGTYYLMGGGSSTLAEGWDGTNWTPQTTNNPAASNNNSFANISCNPMALGPPGAPCQAVGASDYGPLAESFDGTNWSTPEATNSPPNATLSDVSCTAATKCNAVGSYTDYSFGATYTLAERWDGTSWSPQPTPNAALFAVGNATNIGPSSATLTGTVYPEGATVTTCYFEYGVTTDYGSTIPCAQSVGGGNSPVAVSADISGLAPDTTYYFDLVAANAAGGADGGVSSACYGCQSGSSFATSGSSQPPVGCQPPSSVSASPGADVSGNALDELTAVTATVSDPDPTLTRSDYQLTVDWGDGSGAVQASAAALPPGLGQVCNVFQVKSTHAYIGPGTYTITTKISKVAGPAAPATVTVTETATIQGYDAKACPFTEIPAPVAPDLSQQIFEKRLRSFSTTLEGTVSLDGGFGLGSPTFCSLNTALNHVYGATDRKTHDKLALFPVTLGARSLGVTLPTTPEFKFDISTLKFVATDSPDWAAAPPNQSLFFHWDGPTVEFGGGETLKAEVDGHPGDFAALPSLEVPLMSVSAATLGIQLVNELPRNRLYASLLLTPEGALSLNFSPFSLSGVCEADAAAMGSGLFTTTVNDAISSAADAGSGVVSREFSGLRVDASALANSFGLVNDIVNTICVYSGESIDTAVARAQLIAVGLILAPEGAGDLVVLIDNALPRGFELVPAFASSAGLANARPTMASGPVRIGVLEVRTVRLSGPTGLHLGPLPRSALVRAAHSVLAVDVAARVNRLLVSSATLSPGKEITVVAARLGKRTRRAIVTLVGPGYSALRVLKVHLGLAGGSIQLPNRMQPGRWTLAIVSYANLREHGHHVSGAAEMRLAIFTVHAAPRHRRPKPH